MARFLAITILFMLLAGGAHASCPSSLQLKDNTGLTAQGKYTDDGSGNCMVNTAEADGANIALGAKADSAWSSGSGSVIALLKNLANTLSSILTSVQSPPSLGTSGGWTPFTKTALSTTVTAVKASAGQLGFVQCDNPNSSASYIQLFNVAAGSVVLGSTAPTQVMSIPANLSNGFVMNLVGMQYSTAISVAATTTATGSSATSSALNCSFGFN